MGPWAPLTRLSCLSPSPRPGGSGHQHQARRPRSCAHQWHWHVSASHRLSGLRPLGSKPHAPSYRDQLWSGAKLPETWRPAGRGRRWREERGRTHTPGTCTSIPQTSSKCDVNASRGKSRLRDTNAKPKLSNTKSVTLGHETRTEAAQQECGRRAPPQTFLPRGPGPAQRPPPPEPPQPRGRLLG